METQTALGYAEPMKQQPTLQDAMSELLAVLGFGAMAREVRTEKDTERLSRYARIIVKQSPESKRLALANQFRLAGLM